jgi:uncharacterized protein YqjF (DUF2071 family)
MVSPLPGNDSIDRVAPTRRPPGSAVMRQNWFDLLFLHWAVPADLLRSLLPPGLELDTYAGRAYVGLVPFTMTGVRPIWTPPFPPLSNFHETNVRTYVHRKGRDPGIWFFSLDAANLIAVRLARAWFKLPYYYARMEMEKENLLSETLEVRYRTERLWPQPLPACCEVHYAPAGPAAPAQVGTLEHFLVERYILYAYAQGHLYRGRIHHASYPLQPAAVSHLEENLVAAAGVVRPDVAPLMHYAREVRVQIFPLQRLDKA